MKISIYGGGCKNCQTLYENTQRAVSELGIDCEIEKITDMEKIMEAGVMLTPAFAIDGEIKFSQKVPGADELKKIISQAS
ncbi:MAG: thioredoxin family protein [Gammaproteobacteria bacterium]|nr:MAG: thioredoxin family protein [Gammaproteobacteria bacterium]